MTRLDCMIGSSAAMRMAVSQAIDHCRQRKAFGALLSDQPIMTAVLADLAIEAEAALTLTMRIARALDHRDHGHEDALVRIERSDRQILDLQAELRAMPMRRLDAFERLGRDGRRPDAAPLSRGPGRTRSGRGAATCSASTLPARSSVRRRRWKPASPKSAAARGESAALDREAAALKDDITSFSSALESRARDLCDRLALTLQAAALIRAGSPVAGAFSRSRLETRGAHNYGALARRRREADRGPRRAAMNPIPSGQIALGSRLFGQLFQFRHRLFHGPMMRLLRTGGSDPFDIARGDADVGDMRPLRFQELVMSFSTTRSAWSHLRRTASPALLDSEKTAASR